MALAPCRECGQPVSSEAMTCPQCGVGQPTGQMPVGRTVTIAPPPGGPSASASWGILVVVLIALGLLFGPSIMRHFGRSTLTGGKTDGIVHVTAPEGSCWTGAIGGATQEGCGDQTFPVHDSLGLFSSNAQKKDDGPWTLTISVEVDGNVIATNSTTAAYGVTQVVAGG